jgi:hypothetical protein
LSGTAECNHLNNHHRFAAGMFEAQPPCRADSANASVYDSGNIVEGWDGPVWRGFSGSVPSDYLVDEPFPTLSDERIMDTADALAYVLANAGATLPKRDAVDQRIVDEVTSGAGRRVNHPDEVGGWPDLTI